MRLRVVAEDAKCSFDYAPDTADWKTLVSDADATLLTTEVAGGFVGATVGIGMYARTDERPQGMPSVNTQKKAEYPASAESSLELDCCFPHHRSRSDNRAARLRSRRISRFRAETGI
jgi:hypothetical protein